jgi:hypothetical protein
VTKKLIILPEYDDEEGVDLGSNLLRAARSPMGGEVRDVRGSHGSLEGSNPNLSIPPEIVIQRSSTYLPVG